MFGESKVLRISVHLADQQAVSGYHCGHKQEKFPVALLKCWSVKKLHQPDTSARDTKIQMVKPATPSLWI